MLDIRFVRENIDLVNKAMESRNFTWDSKRFLQLDEDRRSAIAQEEALLSQRNTISKSIGALMGEGKKEEAEAAKAEVAKLKEKIATTPICTSRPSLRSTSSSSRSRTFLPKPRRSAKTKTITPRCVVGARRPRSISNSRRIGILAWIWVSSISSAR